MSSLALSIPLGSPLHLSQWSESERQTEQATPFLSPTPIVAIYHETIGKMPSTISVCGTNAAEWDDKTAGETDAEKERRRRSEKNKENEGMKAGEEAKTWKRKQEVEYWEQWKKIKAVTRIKTQEVKAVKTMERHVFMPSKRQHGIILEALILQQREQV